MYLTNSPIVIPSDDKYYVVKKISIDTAFFALDEEGFTSAIGHQGTVDVLKELLPVFKSEIILNRIEIKEPSDQIVFKLKGRLPEGKILSKDEIEKIGYEFWSISVFDKKDKKSGCTLGVPGPFVGSEDEKDQYREEHRKVNNSTKKGKWRPD